MVLWQSNTIYFIIKRKTFLLKWSKTDRSILMILYVVQFDSGTITRYIVKNDYRTNDFRALYCEVVVLAYRLRNKIAQSEFLIFNIMKCLLGDSNLWLLIRKTWAHYCHRFKPLSFYRSLFLEPVWLRFKSNTYLTLILFSWKFVYNFKSNELWALYK